VLPLAGIPDCVGPGRVTLTLIVVVEGFNVVEGGFKVLEVVVSKLKL
jgi:hypothetical protein